MKQKELLHRLETMWPQPGQPEVFQAMRAVVTTLTEQYAPGMVSAVQAEARGNIRHAVAIAVHHGVPPTDILASFTLLLGTCRTKIHAR